MCIDIKTFSDLLSLHSGSGRILPNPLSSTCIDYIITSKSISRSCIHYIIAHQSISRSSIDIKTFSYLLSLHSGSGRILPDSLSSSCIDYIITCKKHFQINCRFINILAIVIYHCCYAEDLKRLKAICHLCYVGGVRDFSHPPPLRGKNRICHSFYCRTCHVLHPTHF